MYHHDHHPGHCPAHWLGSGPSWGWQVGLPHRIMQTPVTPLFLSHFFAPNLYRHWTWELFLWKPSHTYPGKSPMGYNGMYFWVGVHCIVLSAWWLCATIVCQITWKFCGRQMFSCMNKWHWICFLVIYFSQLVYFPYIGKRKLTEALWDRGFMNG